jgi:hypothetical protein
MLVENDNVGLNNKFVNERMIECENEINKNISSTLSKLYEL